MNKIPVRKSDNIKADGIAVGLLFGSGSQAKLTTKTITENRTYRAEDEPVGPGEAKYDGYSEVTAAVPTYEEEYEEALEQLEALQECQAGVVEVLEQLTGVTAQNCDDIKDLIKQVAAPSDPTSGEDTGTPPGEEEQEAVEDGTATSEETEQMEEEHTPDGEDPPSHTPGEPTVVPSGEDEENPEIPHKRYFAINGLGWYAVTFKKNNIFEGNDGTMWPKTNGWYVYWDTVIDVMVTKIHEGVETIVTTGQIHAHSYGNPNYPYDPDYSGDDTRPGKTLGWKGHSNFGTPTPYITYYIDNQSRRVRVQTKTWFISGSGATSENTNTYDFSLV